MHATLSRSAALGLALVAMLSRAFLPDGWMPNAQTNGSLLAICSVQPTPHDHKVPPTEGHTHVPCAFAAASTLAPPALVSLALGTSVPGWRVPAPVQQEQIDSVRPHRPNIARGPPAFA